jgi:hypothetical protein
MNYLSIQVASSGRVDQHLALGDLRTTKERDVCRLLHEHSFQMLTCEVATCSKGMPECSNVLSNETVFIPCRSCR